MNSTIRTLVDTRYNVQKLRIAFENREGAINRGETVGFKEKGEKEPLAIKYAKMFDQLEDKITEDLIERAKEEPIIKELVSLKGIDFNTAAQICSMIDISKCNTISSLWRYSGYGCDENGNIDRLKKGEKACFNKRLKSLMHVIATNFIRCRTETPFKKVYDDAKKK